MASKNQKPDREETAEGTETERANWDGLPQEVLNMIFNHLPVNDLLSSSVVSKNWKKASRDVLKRSRECYACIKDFPQDLQDLDEIIASKSFTQMFNGINIKIKPGQHDGTADWKPEFSRSFAENILQSKGNRRKLETSKRKLHAILCNQWKYLNLDMGGDWKQVLSIDDALLLRELISAASESLLKLVVVQDEDCGFMCCCGKEFSKLKVLQIQNEDSLEDSCLEKFVLEFAPNLEEITGDMLVVEVHSPGNPLMLKRVTSILVDPDDVIPQAGLMEGFRYVSGLYQLDLQGYHCTKSDDVSALFSMVLNSLNTLEELLMYTLDFYKLVKMADEIKFPNLRRLSLATHCDMPLRDEIAVLKLLNLPNLGPNLEHMKLSVDEVDDADEEDEISFEEPEGVDQSELPLQIEYKCREGQYGHECLLLLNQIYPKMKKVKFLEWVPGGDYKINSMFSDARSLEYLEIDVSVRNNCDDPDPDVAIAAILCGINIEEAEFLHNGSPRNNAKLNPYIVPIRPSLFNSKNLKELKITVEENYSGAFVNHSWVIQVTENLPVRHVRKLEVTFEGTEASYNNLDGLRALTTLLCAQVKEN